LLILLFLYLSGFNNIICIATTPPPPVMLVSAYYADCVAMQHGTVFAYARIMPGLCRLCCSAVYVAVLHQYRVTQIDVAPKLCRARIPDQVCQDKGFP